MNEFVTSLDTEEPSPKATVVIAEETMSPQEAEMYIMLRQLRCRQGQSLACPARIIIGQSGVVLECPTCGWVGQSYPNVESD